MTKAITASELKYRGEQAGKNAAAAAQAGKLMSTVSTVISGKGTDKEKEKRSEAGNRDNVNKRPSGQGKSNRRRGGCRGNPDFARYRRNQ